VVLLMALVLALMSASPAMAIHKEGHTNRGNQAYDGPDKNQGGGQEFPKKAKHCSKCEPI